MCGFLGIRPGVAERDIAQEALPDRMVDMAVVDAE
jgi:hypothetical protein